MAAAEEAEVEAAELHPTTQQLLDLNDEDLYQVMTEALQNRPEIAFSVVKFAIPDLTFAPMKALTQNRFKGSIKDYSSILGRGNIDCPDISEKFGQDVTLNIKGLTGINKGDEVSFAVLLGEDIEPHAYDVERVSKEQPKKINPPPPAARPNAEDKGQNSPPDGSGAQTEPEELEWGTVTSVGRGHCIVRPESGIEEDVFIRSDVANPQELTVGGAVAFKLHVNSKGQHMASAPVWTLFGQLTEAGILPTGEFIGTVGRVAPSGTTFIDCPAVAAVHGREAAAHQKTVAQCDLNPEQVIGFSVHVSDAGKIWVSAPCWKCCSSNIRGINPVPFVCKPLADGSPAQLPQSSPPAASGKAEKGFGKGDINPPPEPVMMSGSHAGAEIPATSEEVYFGTVAVQAAQGFAFTCSAFEEDVWADRSVVPSRDLSRDDIVAFKVNVNGRGSASAVSPVWKRVGGGKKEGEDLEFANYVGVVQAPTPGGASFIECPALMEEHGRACASHHQITEQCGLREGDVIAFTPHISDSGKIWLSAPCWKVVGKPSPGAIEDFVASLGMQMPPLSTVPTVPSGKGFSKDSGKGGKDFGKGGKDFGKGKDYGGKDFGGKDYGGKDYGKGKDTGKGKDAGKGKDYGKGYHQERSYEDKGISKGKGKAPDWNEKGGSSKGKAVLYKPAGKGEKGGSWGEEPATKRLRTLTYGKGK
eukprot:TRINITY_DN16306_c0_g1_i1.p1 TRINITY_DN16306_c0_g1~~TRINITY_DN16306_c0_g1_i1.p1  ORF type:complete len:699 (-),score=165.34 TRINITY_DN16306_c0_g1_i1:81-2177(-)